MALSEVSGTMINPPALNTNVTRTNNAIYSEYGRTGSYAQVDVKVKARRSLMGIFLYLSSDNEAKVKVFAEVTKKGLWLKGMEKDDDRMILIASIMQGIKHNPPSERIQCVVD